MFERPHLQSLKRRILEPRRFIQVLIGPRQVGKTTLILQLLKQTDIPSLYASADAVSAGNTSWLEQIWESARLQKKTKSAESYLLVLDEIQKISNWSETVKKLWDEDSLEPNNIKVIILGSSRLLIQHGLTESLAGRFETTYLPHWTYLEMNHAFGWNTCQFAWFGGYPGAVDLINDEERWKKYICDALIETSVSKDILMLSRVDKPALMKRLFEIGCLYSGQILSFTKIQGQLLDAGNTTTLSNYLNLLDTAGLLGGISKYAADIIRIRASSPKFQVHNQALLSAQHPAAFASILQQPSAWGRIVESAIGSHLINYAVSEGLTIYYWREKNAEVDFIIEKNKRILALEIKSNDSKSTKGMEVFIKKFNPHKVYLIDNKHLPWTEFLTINPAELF